MTRYRPPGLVRAIVHAYEIKKLSLKTIARRHGISHSLVKAILKEENVNRRIRHNRPFRPLSLLKAWDDIEIVDPDFDKIYGHVDPAEIGALGWEYTDCNVSGIYAGDEWNVGRHGRLPTSPAFPARDRPTGILAPSDMLGLGDPRDLIKARSAW